MPKLTLRDLFGFVTIVALVLGWAVDHWRHNAFMAEILKENRALWGQATFIHKGVPGYEPVTLLFDKNDGSMKVLHRTESR